MFDQIFSMQGQLNSFIGRNTLNNEDTIQLDSYVFDYLLAMNSEMAETIIAFNNNDKQNVGVEIIDILHFLVSAVQCLNVSHETFTKYFDIGYADKRVKKSQTYIANMYGYLWAATDQTNWKWWTKEGKASPRFITILNRNNIINMIYCLIEEFGRLCSKMKYTKEKIFSIYKQKNEKNFNRQKTGYSIANKQEDCKDIKV